jgi:hypothetical protein
MTLNIKTIGELVQSSQALVASIKGGVSTVEAAAEEVERLRKKLAQSAPPGATGAVSVGYSDEAQQKAILAKIVALQGNLPAAAGNPALDGALRADLANEFMDLAATEAAIAVSKIVSFSQADRTRIAALIQQAELDTAKRKQLAAVLNAAVGIAEAALKVATTVAAA